MWLKGYRSFGYPVQNTYECSYLHNEVGGVQCGRPKATQHCSFTYSFQGVADTLRFSLSFENPTKTISICSPLASA